MEQFGNLVLDLSSPVSGEANHLRTIVTNIGDSPRGLFVDQSRNEVYLCTGGGDDVNVYPSSSDGATAPSRTINPTNIDGNFSGIFIDFTRM